MAYVIPMSGDADAIGYTLILPPSSMTTFLPIRSQSRLPDAAIVDMAVVLSTPSMAGRQSVAWALCTRHKWLEGVLTQRSPSLVCAIEPASAVRRFGSLAGAKRPSTIDPNL